VLASAKRARQARPPIDSPSVGEVFLPDMRGARPALGRRFLPCAVSDAHRQFSPGPVRRAGISRRVRGVSPWHSLRSFPSEREGLARQCVRAAVLLAKLANSAKPRGSQDSQLSQGLPVFEGTKNGTASQRRAASRRVGARGGEEEKKRDDQIPSSFFRTIEHQVVYGSERVEATTGKGCSGTVLRQASSRNPLNSLTSHARKIRSFRKGCPFLREQKTALRASGEPPVVG
jgi:hypothetical protein